MTPEEFNIQQSEISDAELIRLADKEVGELAKSGGRSHTMHIPPKVTDTDMVLSNLVKRFEKSLTPSPMHGNTIEAASKYLSLKRREIQKHAGLFATPTTRDYDEWMVSYAQQFQKQNWVSDEEIEEIANEECKMPSDWPYEFDLLDIFEQGAKWVRSKAFPNGKPE